MKGIPVRIEIGPRDLEQGTVLITTRHDRNKQSIKLDELVSKLPTILKDMHDTLYENALKHVEEHTYTAKTYEEFKTLIEDGGYIKMSISGEDAELIIKQDTAATARVILTEEPLITELCPVTNKNATQTVLFARAY